MIPRFSVHRRVVLAVAAAAIALSLAAPGSARAGCILLILCSPAPTSSAPAPAPTVVPLPKFFDPSSVWNVPLPDSAPIASNSPQLVAAMQYALTTYLPWINTTSYSAPVYTVPSGQKTVKVTLRNNKWNAAQVKLQSDFNYVPIPSGAKASNDSDASLVIWQPSTDTMWEMWSVQYNWLVGWSFAWGAKIQHVSTDPGIVSVPYGASASGLAAVGGLMTISELQKGAIDHALSFSFPHPTYGTFVWPADRTDGDGPATSIPEGTRFRLPADLNVEALGLSPMATMMAKAVQRYGMIVHDKSNAVAFFAEDPSQYTAKGMANPYTALFNGQQPDKVLAGFPWDKLEAIVPEPVSAMPAVSPTNQAAVTDGPAPAASAPPTPQPGSALVVSGPTRRRDF